MKEEYISILKDSLNKKNNILKQILDLSKEQTVIINEEETDWDAFAKNTEDKGALIDEITKLDEGFEIIYEKVKEELSGNKEKYSKQISEMKILIKSITERSAEIQSIETRNKQRIEAQFAKSKKTIKQAKMGTKAAMEYYEKMNKINNVSPQMMDKKS